MDPLGGNPWWTLLVAVLPALLCTILIFMDQQITAVIINRKEHKLKVSTLPLTSAENRKGASGGILVLSNLIYLRNSNRKQIFFHKDRCFAGKNNARH